MVDAWTDMASTQSQADARTSLNNGLTRLTNNHIDSTEPGNKVAGMWWMDSSTNQIKVYDGSAWRTIATYNVANGNIAFLDDATFTAAVGGVSATGASHFTISSQVTDRSVMSVSTRLGAISGSDNRFVWMVPASGTFEVVGCYVVSDTATSGSDGSNNYTFQLANLTEGVDLFSSAKTTNGAELAANARYSLAGTLQYHQKGDLDGGDVLELQVTKTGSPTDLSSAEVAVQIDFKAHMF